MQERVIVSPSVFVAGLVSLISVIAVWLQVAADVRQFLTMAETGQDMEEYEVIVCGQAHFQPQLRVFPRTCTFAI